jgi:DNA-binding CsgD family transcriptional regulator
MFEALGFNKVTESVYLALLRCPDADVSTVAGQLGIAVAKVHAALDDLTGMSLVYRPWPDAHRPCLVNPEIGLSALLARQQTEMARHRQAVEESRAAFATFVANQTQTGSADHEPGVEHLTGTEKIRDRIQVLTSSCQREVCAFMADAATPAPFEPIWTEPGVIDRGVRIRTVYLDSIRNNRTTMDYVRRIGELGSEVRTAPTLPIRLLIIDRDVALVPGRTADNDAAALLVSADGVLAGLLALFQFVWKMATPLAATRRRDGAGLSSQERHVLRLLGEGRTDEVISRRLGVSVRTARRVASDLLTRLGARSRFQAGALALARGWIDESDLQ